MRAVYDKLYEYCRYEIQDIVDVLGPELCLELSIIIDTVEDYLEYHPSATQYQEECVNQLVDDFLYTMNHFPNNHQIKPKSHKLSKVILNQYSELTGDESFK